MRAIHPAFGWGLLGLVLLIGCGQAEMYESGGKFSSVGQQIDGPVPASEMTRAPNEAVEGEASRGPGELGLERKIVYTAHVDLVVEDFDALETDLRKLIQEHDGFIASSNVEVAQRDRRQGSWTIRIPVDQFDLFLAAAKKLGELRSSGIDSQDRTAEYFDVDAALTNKRKTLERFKKLAEERDADLEHVREVEKDIERVQGEIDQLSGRIRLLDNLTSLTTVTLSAQEIKDYVPPESPSFGTEISRSFSQSLDSLEFAGRRLVIVAVALAPWLVVFLVVAVPGGLLVRFLRRRRAK